MDQPPATQSPSPPHSVAGTPAQPVTEPRAFDSAQLLDGRNQVAIRHGEELYSLRLTRNGKLILTK